MRKAELGSGSRNRRRKLIEYEGSSHACFGRPRRRVGPLQEPCSDIRTGQPYCTPGEGLVCSQTPVCPPNKMGQEYAPFNPQPRCAQESSACWLTFWAGCRCSSGAVAHSLGQGHGGGGGTGETPCPSELEELADILLAADRRGNRVRLIIV